MLGGTSQQNEVTNGNSNTKTKSLTFKDWKSLKDVQEKSKERLESKTNGRQNVQPTINNKQLFNAHSDIRNISNYNKSCSSSGNRFMPGNFFLNHLAGYLPLNNSDRTYFNNNNTRHESNWESINNCFNHFRARNNFSPTPNFDGYKDFEFSNKSTKSSFGKYDYEYKYSKSFGQSDNFFASDCAYPQRDTMQKPLLNPFRYGDKDNRLLEQFDKSRYNKDDKKAKSNKKPNKSKNSVHKSFSTDTKSISKEPEVYIPNPKSILDGRPYIPKPKIPEPNFEITHEEKKQQWKEYRKAMKPFKNRDFYNAKRVVQRFGKKALSELDEKQLFRLKNAQEFVAAYKARLCEKYPNYVKAENSSNDLGEIYTLKTVPANQSILMNPPANKIVS